MKPMFVTFAAAALPLAAQAQVRFEIQCLPPAQQAEVRAKAQEITSRSDTDRTASVASFGPGFSAQDARNERAAREAALSECAFGARSKGGSAAELCTKEVVALQVAAQHVEDVESGLAARRRPLDREERSQLEALRAQYPACETRPGPDNAVIRRPARAD